MKKKRLLVTVAILLITSLFLFANGDSETPEATAPSTAPGTTVAPVAPEDTGTQYTLKFSWADPFDPLKQSTSAYAVVFKQEVERLSGGRIKGRALSCWTDW